MIVGASLRGLAIAELEIDIKKRWGFPTEGRPYNDSQVAASEEGSSQ
jgi:hypothetical protein